LRAVYSPRLWLLVWLGIGAAGLLYVILSAALSGGDEKARPAASARVFSDPALAVGAMEKFIFAPEARQAPTDEFLAGGETTSLGAFRGRVTLVNFWATWCAPCLRELPALDALEGALGGKDFAVVAVAADPKGPEEAAAFLDKLGVKRLGRYADPKLKLVIATGGSAALPLSILYDRDGREIGRLLGEADWSSLEAQALIRAAMAAP
jgi:thiol-disulfide isomerase/thioredoxin